MKKNVVVIGGGLAGTLICNRLIENCDVTLLELGEKDGITYPKIDFVRKEFGEVKTFCLGGGGTTNLWHNGLMPINKEDVISEEFRDVLVEAESYMDQAASNLYFKNKSYLFEYNNSLSEMGLIAKKVGIFKDGIDCLLYPKRYKKVIVDEKVEACYSVKDIAFVVKGRRIQSVRYCIGTREYFVNPNIMVICAGALGTPLLVEKLLLAANRSFDQLGTGLADHPIGFIGKIKVKKDVAKIVRKLSLHDKGNYECRTAFRLKSECGKYTCCAYFRPAMTMQNKLSIYKYKSRLGASSGKERIRNMFSVKILHPDILVEVFSYLFGAYIPTRTYNILLLLEQKRGRNRVSYNGGRLRVDWGISEEELAIYNGLLRKLNDMLSHVADKLNVTMDISEEWLWSSAHHSGTIGLGGGADDLIDKDLKLKFCDNVYVCDGSVIQEHSYANTGLTIGQLAMRLAERVENEGVASYSFQTSRDNWKRRP